MSVTKRLEIEHANNDSAVHRFNHHTTKTPKYCMYTVVHTSEREKTVSCISRMVLSWNKNTYNLYQYLNSGPRFHFQWLHKAYLFLSVSLTKAKTPALSHDLPMPRKKRRIYAFPNEINRKWNANNLGQDLNSSPVPTTMIVQTRPSFKRCSNLQSVLFRCVQAAYETRTLLWRSANQAC